LAINLHAVEHRQLAHLDDLDAELLGLLALMPSHGPNADLDQTFGRAFLHDAGKRASMRQPIPFQFVVKIGMRVEVEDGQSANVLAKARTIGKVIEWSPPDKPDADLGRAVLRPSFRWLQTAPQK